MSEGNPIERQETGNGQHIPGLSSFDPSVDTYAMKVAKLRELEALIKADEELEKKIRVDRKKGIPLPIAEKMLEDTINRLTENGKKRDKLMGKTVQ